MLGTLEVSLAHPNLQRLGPHPALTDEEPDFGSKDIVPKSKPEIHPEDCLLEGDCLFYVSIPLETEFVRAM